MIDYHATRFEDVAEDVDVVLDLVGGETGVRSLRTLRPGGLVIAVPQRGLGRAGDGRAAGR
ncbi:zinc-binding dehydrogenase [Actinoplanes sp. NPDC089786]|uniref:zinc-binding dehydrogenase n=1 Tax=Actinoplanes sp. NPDC089786 TaxID=3155185 RepID=UPI003421DD77